MTKREYLDAKYPLWREDFACKTALEWVETFKREQGTSTFDACMALNTAAWIMAQESLPSPQKRSWKAGATNRVAPY